MLNQELIQQGAEAKIFLDKEKNLIIKERIKKSYRIKEIDEKLIKRRTKSEAKILERLLNQINIPKIKGIEGNKLIIEYIPGKKISENLENLSLKEQKNIMKDLGNQVAKLHNEDIIHGDLTTSNFIINEKGKIYIIDFGLSFISSKIEDKANDIYLLKQALKTKHSKNFEFLFKEFLKEYSKNTKGNNKILERLQIIEKRGRYK